MTLAREAGRTSNTTPGDPDLVDPVAVSRRAVGIDRIGVCLAGILGIAPLLPAGPTYLGWPRFAYVELVVPALFLAWIAARLTAREPAARPSPLPLWPWDLFAAMVVGAAVLGLMADNRVGSPVFVARLLAAPGELFGPVHHTAYPLYSLRVAVTLFEGWLAFRLVLATCRRAPDPRRRANVALAGWGAGFAVAAVFAVVQYVFRFHLHPYWVKANPALVRAHSTLDDPNALGACLVLGIGLLAGLLYLERQRRWRWAVLLAIGAAGLVTTMSRSALGAAVIAPAAMLAIGPVPTTRLLQHVRTGARLVVGGIAVAILVSMVLREFTSEQRKTKPSGPIGMVVETFDPREPTGWVLRGRLPWWQAAVAMFRERPIVGVGLGRYPRLMQSYGGGKVPENAHNFFLQLLAECGIVGLAAFLPLCVTTCRGLARGVGRADGDRPRAVALGGVIGALAFLITLLTGHTLLLPSGQLAWASFVALTAVIASPGRREADASTRSPGRTAGFALAMMAVALFAPAAGYVRGVEPWFGDWGYNAGLHDEERKADGTRYRWTTGKALVDLAVPHGATALIVETAAVHPMRGGVPTRLRIEAGRVVRDGVVTAPGTERVSVPLPEGARRIVLAIHVEPTFVPATAGVSRDSRELGVQLFVPAFEKRDAAARR